MSQSPRLGQPRHFVVFDGETGEVVAGFKTSPFRLKQQMASFTGMKVMRVNSIQRISGARVVDGMFIPGPKPERKSFDFSQPSPFLNR